MRHSCSPGRSLRAGGVGEVSPRAPRRKRGSRRRHFPRDRTRPPCAMASSRTQQHSARSVAATGVRNRAICRSFLSNSRVPRACEPFHPTARLPLRTHVPPTPNPPHRRVSPRARRRRAAPRGRSARDAGGPAGATRTRPSAPHEAAVRARASPRRAVAASAALRHARDPAGAGAHGRAAAVERHRAPAARGGWGSKQEPAASYSPRPLRAKYHRR
jgi:hypothetical protein